MKTVIYVVFFLHIFNFVCSKNSHMLINITYGDSTLKMNYKFALMN